MLIVMCDEFSKPKLSSKFDVSFILDNINIVVPNYTSINQPKKWSSNLQAIVMISLPIQNASPDFYNKSLYGEVYWLISNHNFKINTYCWFSF